MSTFSRRGFLAGLAAATGVAAASLPGAGVLRPRKAEATTRDRAEDGARKRYASLIDLTRCDGCADRDTPACVAACRSANAERFPDPDPDKIKDYWPQPIHEDWSGRRQVTDRLTPYNWTFVQRLTVEHEGEEREVHVPRRCMHCDNPPCVKLCPFGVAKQEKDGPTWIDASLCMGGAKCRTVCPWDVPQRQAGVGVYTYLDPMPVGGGVMYKCDLCRETLAEGGTPACERSCPNGAIRIGDRGELEADAERLAREYGGDEWEAHLYGRSEHAGTSTFYVSKVPFEAIDAAIVKQGEARRAALAETNPKAAAAFSPMRMHPATNVIERHSGLALGSVLVPLAGAAAAFAMTVSKVEKKKESSNG